MTDSYDLNVNNYTDDELIKLIKLKEPYSDVNVMNTISKNIKKYHKNKELVSFFTDIQERLINRNIEIKKNQYANFGNEENKEFSKILPPGRDSDVYHNRVRPVIIHENLNTVPTYNQEYVGGELNPVKKRVITKLLPIDTRYRLNYDTTSSTNFSISLPDTIKNVVSMKLNSLEFPISSYNLSETLDTNTFNIIYNSTNYTIDISQGNYTADELENYLYNVAAGTGVFFNPPFNGNVGVDFDSKYAKFIIELTPTGIAAGDTIALDFSSNKFPERDIKFNLGWMLGYRKSYYSGLQRYVPEAVYDTGGTRNINLVVNDYNNNNSEIYINPFWSGPMKYNILARIHQPAATNTIIFNDSSDLQFKKREYFGPVNIKRLQIQVLNDNFEVIDNNNMDYSLTLEFKCLYNL